MFTDEYVEHRWYIHSGILLSNKNNKLVTHNKNDKSQKYYVEQKKPIRKEYILYAFIHMKFQNKQN